MKLDDEHADDMALKPGAVPLYEQIKQHLIQLIASGQLAPGDRLPGENEIASRFRVARLTSHRAMRELARDGWIQRVHGVGTFVAPQRETSPTSTIYNIADEVRTKGKTFTTKVDLLEVSAVGSMVATEMKVPEGTHLFHSLIIYYADGVPVQLEDRFVSPAFAPRYLNQDFHQGSTTDYLQSIAPADEAEQIIEATMPDAMSRRLLDIGKGEACLVVIRRTWVRGLLTSYTRFIHPGSRRRLVSRSSTTTQASAEISSFKLADSCAARQQALDQDTFAFLGL